MADRVYLLGCGDHGNVVLDTLLETGAPVAGILDPGMPMGERVFDVAVLGGDEVLDELDSAHNVLANGVGANPKTGARWRLFARMVSRGFRFRTVRHPSVIIGRGCHLGSGAQLMAGVILQSRVVVGDNAMINTGAIVEHDCRIAPHAVVSPGATLCGDAVIGEGSFIGAGAVILPGVHVGARVIIGAGAVVRETVPDTWILAGNPASRIGESRE